MSRARRSTSSPVQLFPFLAVLVSALGALVLLLVAINRQVSLQAVAAAFQALRQQTSDEETSLISRRQELEHDLSALRSHLAALHGEQLTIERTLELGGRQVQAIATRCGREEQARLQALESRADMEARIAAIRQQIAAIQAARNQSLSQPADPDRTFVPVVHPGANGTNRQPIYLECTSRGITIQPDGVLLAAEVLVHESGRTMLVRAVQSLSQYYLERDVGKETARAYREWEPYPLLLVRPDGTQLFYAARQALEQLNAPFGYELIEADWKLQYPKPDPIARTAITAALDSFLMDVPGARSRPGLGHVSSGRASQSSDRLALTPNLGRILGLEPEPDPVGSAGESTQWQDNQDQAGLPQTEAASRAAHGVTRLPVNRAQRPPGEPDASGISNTTARIGIDGPSGKSAKAESNESVSTTPPSNVLPAGPAPGGRPSTPDGPAAAPPAASVARQRTASSNPPQQSNTARFSRDEPAANQEPDDLSEIANFGRATSIGKIPIPRTIEIDCLATGLVITNRQRFVRIRDAASCSEALPTLFEELGSIVSGWGPPGMTFHWQPKLLCLVHPDGLEMYYGLWKALIGSSLPIEHVLVAEDVIAGSDALFSHQTSRPPLTGFKTME